MTSNETSLRICLLQFASQDDLPKTLIHLEELVERAANEQQPQIIALPECFNFAYCTESSIINAMAETIENGKTCRTLSQLSKKFGVYIVGGTIVERDGDNLYNTSTVWNPSGELIARYRKVHLCNYHSEEGVNIVEVDIFKPGNEIATFQVNGIKCGIEICYDVHFEELAKTYRKAGCDVIFFPAAFPISIGPQYWELLHRTRAVDNQLFVAAISPARNEQATYVVYGHSMIIDPTGNVLAKANTGEEIIFYEIDLKVGQKFRRELPLNASRRPEVYNK